ncbi:MAG: tetratricopeptide repeat protein [Proteobacteria bacterium]|nr:tetratricopeptide repeat protein [Pseudomonadota bacterium]HQR03487.1 tetratricopeptide repeat protein [Rhodocyclaceae bacterium]
MARRLTALLLGAAGLGLAGCGGMMNNPSLSEASALQQSAVLAYESGDDAKAEALYQGLARMAPNDPETWLRLGNLYARSNRPDLAADAYQRALLTAPNDVRLWYNLGIIRQRQAHAALIRAHELAGDNEALRQRTEALARQLQPDTPEKDGHATP